MPKGLQEARRSGRELRLGCRPRREQPPAVCSGEESDTMIDWIRGGGRRGLKGDSQVSGGHKAWRSQKKAK